MSLLHRHPLDEASPVEPLRPVPATTRPPLPLGAPARSIAALAGLRSEAPVPLPSRNLIEYTAAVSVAIDADYERHLDTLRTIDEISAMLTEHPELLAPPSHPGPRLWLRRIVTELAPFTAKAGA